MWREIKADVGWAKRTPRAKIGAGADAAASEPTLRAVGTRIAAAALTRFAHPTNY